MLGVIDVVLMFRAARAASVTSANPVRRAAERTDRHRTGVLIMNGPVASLNTAWFALIGLLWTGYLVLDGFHFGVGVLSLAIGRDDLDLRLARDAIGPVWDGNEVWLIVAAGATFAAFPVCVRQPVQRLLPRAVRVLVALIVRGVSFEFRGKRDSARWRGGWDVALAIGSLVPAFAWGVVFTDQVRGLPLSPSGLYLGGLPGLLAPVAVVGGLASLAMFTAHGAAFLSLKTAGPLAARAARGAAGPPLAGALVVGAAAWLSAGGSPRPRCPGRHGAGRAGRRLRAGLCGVRDPGPGPPARCGVRPERAGHRGRCRRGLHSLFPGDGLLRSRPGPDRLERRLGTPDPAGHDRGRGDLRPGRAGLPGLELLGVPPAAHQPRPVPASPPPGPSVGAQRDRR